MRLTHDQIVARVTELVSERLGRLADGISPDADIRGVEGVDSVTALRVIAKAEREFGVTLEDEEVFGVASINELAGLIEKKSGAAAP